MVLLDFCLTLMLLLRNVMKACDDIGRNAVHLAAGHTGPTAQKLIELLLDNCQEEELGIILMYNANFG